MSISPRYARVWTSILLVGLIFGVARVIQEGVAQPGAFCFLLATLQVVLFCSVSFQKGRVSLKFLFFLVLILCSAWAIAVPGLRKSSRTKQLNQQLGTICNAVDFAPSLGAFGSLIPIPSSLMNQFLLRVPVAVFLVDSSEDQIIEVASQLAKYDFSGRMDLRVSRCSDKCLRSISEINQLRELSICATQGPTNMGLSHLLDNLDLELLSLAVRCSSSNEHPYSLTTEFLMNAYESQGVSWSVDDQGLTKIGRTGNISIHGLPVTGTFMFSHSAPDRVTSLSLRSTLVGSRRMDWLALCSNIAILEIDGSPIENEVLAVVGRLQKLRWLRLNSTLIDDDGIESLLTLDEDQFSMLWINANLSASKAKEVGNRFSRANRVTVTSQKLSP